jgi:hypothetical protein
MGGCGGRWSSPGLMDRLQRCCRFTAWSNDARVDPASPTRRAAAGAQVLRLQRAPLPHGQDAAPGTILTEPSIGAPSIPQEGRAERPTERTKINNQDQLVELRNDQVDPEEDEQRGDADQDIAQRDGSGRGPPSFDLILAAETRRTPLASKTVKITDVMMETTATMPRAAQSIGIRRRSSVWAS